MGATRYQVMFRYINPATNVAITNNMSNEYTETFDIHTNRHKIMSNIEKEIFEAEDERDEMIMFGNDASNPKYDMIFAYGGTKKYLHKAWENGQWVEKTGVKTGYPYVVKDVYVRIPMTPWFLSSCYGSLDAAVEKCKILVDMIGMENVKLVKLVPFDQRIRIQ